MIRSNLSTRPFYNERLVHVALTVGALCVLIFTVFNMSRIVSLSSQHTRLSSQAGADERRAAEFRVSANNVRRTMNPQQLEAMAAAAHEANTIIGRRIFSWTELFNRFETTLPPDVRITAVRPKIERDGPAVVSMSVIGRRVEAIDRFIENLESTGAFSNVLSLEETRGDEGLIETTLEGQYRPESAVEPRKIVDQP